MSGENEYLVTWAIRGWEDRGTLGKCLGLTLEKAMDRPMFDGWPCTPGRAKAYRQGWLAAEQGLPRPSRRVRA